MPPLGTFLYPPHGLKGKAAARGRAAWGDLWDGAMLWRLCRHWEWPQGVVIEWNCKDVIQKHSGNAVVFSRSITTWCYTRKDWGGLCVFTDMLIYLIPKFKLEFFLRCVLLTSIWCSRCDQHRVPCPPGALLLPASSQNRPNLIHTGLQKCRLYKTASCPPSVCTEHAKLQSKLNLTHFYFLGLKIKPFSGLSVRPRRNPRGSQMAACGYDTFLSTVLGPLAFLSTP